MLGSKADLHGTGMAVLHDLSLHHREEGMILISLANS